MADIDPYSQIQQLTPRPTSIVDAIAESKRIAEAIMRSNPLRNARVDDGLMVWRGNYAGSGGLADSYLWIGEFSPRDAALDKQQRGFLLTRDDPKHAAALWMYDPFADSRGPGNPLRQTLQMKDADGAQIMSEAQGGGTAFPFGIVPLYGTASSYYLIRTDAGATLKQLPVFGSYRVTGGQRTYYEGYGAMTGHRLRTYLFGNSTSTGVFGVHIQVSFDDGSATFFSGRIDCAAGGSADFLWDLDFAGQGKVGKRVHVRVVAEILSGSDEWCLFFPGYCYSYGQ